MASVTDTFVGEKGFCWNCGSILPMLGDSGSVKCFMCKFEYGPEAFGAMDNHYEICFHSPSDYLSQELLQTAQRPIGNKNAGPIVEKRCAKCGNDTMSYATLQLRSADEGQTIFYTCTRCGCHPMKVEKCPWRCMYLNPCLLFQEAVKYFRYKETENS